MTEVMRKADGSGRKPAAPRMQGSLAAISRARTLKKGHADLPAHKLIVLDLTGRLIVHFTNLSNRTFYLLETKADDEPRAMLKEMRELHSHIMSNLKYVFGADAADGDLLARFRQ